MTLTLTYPAIFSRIDNGFEVTVPDLPGCVATGDDVKKAKYAAEDKASEWMKDNMAEGKAIPDSSSVNTFDIADDEFIRIIVVKVSPPSIHNKILEFITRFNGNGINTQVIRCFTEGCCFWFAQILYERFHEQAKCAIVYDEVANHFATEINSTCYDITGDVTSKYHWQHWDDFAAADKQHAQRIYHDCIMF